MASYFGNGRHNNRAPVRPMEVLFLVFKRFSIVGATQGTLQYDPISTGPESIAAFPRENTRIGAADMPCHGLTSWIYSPRDFPKWAEPEVFRSVRIGKGGWALGSIRKVPGPKRKRQFSSECLGLLGLIAASLV